ncbi:MFS transporter [Amycolatopsis taiwanensis]|uniref:MFS transporter n=1 Tax=Amycolatopsis taiwanensis TaxID=342230 RepID=UPI000480F63D|nr:MFS transporter [Amycolatopsis taiwanensis]
MAGQRYVSGWQWVFLIEGGLAGAIGVASFVLMPTSPAKAKWLDANEKRVLAAAIERDQDRSAESSDHGLRAVLAILRNPQVWYYCLVYALMMLGFYSVTYWLPQIIKLKLHTGSVASGLLSAIPWSWPPQRCWASRATPRGAEAAPSS